MHTTKNESKFSPTLSDTGHSPMRKFGKYANKAKDSTNKGNQTTRLYQDGISKQIMNESKYKASGNTHINGMGAMFSVMKLVSATISMEGHAAKATHMSCWPRPGVGAGTRAMSLAMPGVEGEASPRAKLRLDKYTQHNTNTTKNADHIHDCMRVGKTDSITKG
jgi:hypothetical protein